MWRSIGGINSTMGPLSLFLGLLVLISPWHAQLTSLRLLVMCLGVLLLATCTGWVESREPQEIKKDHWAHLVAMASGMMPLVVVLPIVLADWLLGLVVAVQLLLVWVSAVHWFMSVHLIYLSVRNEPEMPICQICPECLQGTEDDPPAEPTCGHIVILNDNAPCREGSVFYCRYTCCQYATRSKEGLRRHLDGHLLADRVRESGVKEVIEHNENVSWVWVCRGYVAREFGVATPDERVLMPLRREGEKLRVLIPHLQGQYNDAPPVLKGYYLEYLTKARKRLAEVHVMLPEDEEVLV
jgi:hypothetical protein